MARQGRPPAQPDPPSTSGSSSSSAGEEEPHPADALVFEKAAGRQRAGGGGGGEGGGEQPALARARAAAAAARGGGRAAAKRARLSSSDEQEEKDEEEESGELTSSASEEEEEEASDGGGAAPRPAPSPRPPPVPPRPPPTGVTIRPLGAPADDPAAPDPQAAARALLRPPRYWDAFSENGGQASGGMDFVAGRRCHRCGGGGHLARDCPAAVAAKAARPCFLCGGRGHERAACPAVRCYRCGQPGHLARDCGVAASAPQAAQAPPAGPPPCTRCGRAPCPDRGRAWAVAECRTPYQAPDGAAALCLVCGVAGHFSCGGGGGQKRQPALAEPVVGPSCYLCGGRGHGGGECVGGGGRWR